MIGLDKDREGREQPNTTLVRITALNRSAALEARKEGCYKDWLSDGSTPCPLFFLNFFFGSPFDRYVLYWLHATECDRAPEWRKGSRKVGHERMVLGVCEPHHRDNHMQQ